MLLAKLPVNFSEISSTIQMGNLSIYKICIAIFSLVDYARFKLMSILDQDSEFFEGIKIQIKWGNPSLACDLDNERLDESLIVFFSSNAHGKSRFAQLSN